MRAASKDGRSRVKILLEDMEIGAARAARLLRPMANEMRLMIVCQLAEQDMTVGELAVTLPLSQSALSQHLAVLRKEDIVSTRREAQFVWYSLKSDKARSLIDTLCVMFEPEPSVKDTD